MRSFVRKCRLVRQVPGRFNSLPSIELVAWWDQSITVPRQRQTKVSSQNLQVLKSLID
jgi:hypothetical protein